MVAGVDLGIEARVAQDLLQAHAVHADGVAARERREELVERGHGHGGRSPRGSSSIRARLLLHLPQLTPEVDLERAGAFLEPLDARRGRGTE